ncbi:type IV secretory system conjugative DNA transfer family protein [Streptomyces sp. NRRL F-5135]|uniref:type IV secretory system conjugative DNA transfer family protein n=1 Tax=Streptomyces sp. NRRL F-5135 TaxID=1463858 RepID=UPI0004CC3F8C|nr:type IV secretory system conjugative DNA transfer family protein [Streptomyces sp. NRRL F-5135]
MTTPTTTSPRAASTERGIAFVTSAAPIATGILAPLLDGGAAFTAAIAYGGAAGFMAANYMNRLPPELTDNLPAGDIVRAHRSPMFISTLTTGMSLGLGTLRGLDGTDALMAGILNPASIPGIVSLGWWAAVALVPWKLRKVLARKTQTRRTTHPHAASTAGKPASIADGIVMAWGTHISNPTTGAHKHQVLANVLAYTDPATGTILRWTGTILAPAGSGVSVSKETVSSVYKVRPGWVDITPGDHAGEARIEVSMKAPAKLNPSTLEGAWMKYVARPGGLMAKTHLEDVTDDPNTGGQAAYVVADEDLDILKAPDRNELAGAMRTSPLLISYEPIATNPRKAIIRTMKENPLEKGFDFPGLDALKATKGGRVPFGKVISGHPWMFPMFDPVLGALHLVIAGTTGSGKGGAAQLVCLGYHANDAAILYADPKGASNPAIPKMAAYSGLQTYGALGALRISYAILMHRKEEAARLELKNFQPSKMRPWCATALDEAAQVLGPNVPNRKEAVHIVKAGASLGRSLGMPWTLINQTVNLDQIGGEQAIRANLINGGAWLILRTDSGQTNLADLPDGFEGIDPAKIPAVWKSEDDSLIYDPTLPEDDPRRTFGLGFMGAPGGRPGMGRTFTLEDATPHIRPDQVAVPEDFPGWDDATLEEIANTPVRGFEEGGSGSDQDDSSAPKYVNGVDLPKKEPSAEDKVIQALRENSDPMHLEALAGADLEPDDYEIQYMDKTTLLQQTGMKETTLSNTLARLVKEQKIHRPQDGTRGTYGLGPAPTPDE